MDENTSSTITTGRNCVGDFYWMLTLLSHQLILRLLLIVINLILLFSEKNEASPQVYDYSHSHDQFEHPTNEMEYTVDETPSQRATSISLSYPRKIMECEEICNAADRLCLSDAQLTGIVAAILKAGKGNINDFVFSKSSTRRQRIAARHNIDEREMNAFIANPPEHLVGHLDGKLFKDILGSKHSTEKMAILVTGSPHFEEGKLLGIPSLERGTAVMIAGAFIELIRAWKLDTKITAIVFDTTSVNSGHRGGSVLLIEKELNQKLLYLACRHHVLEIYVGSVWTLLFGEVKQPTNPIFKNVKDLWPSIDKDLANVMDLSINGPWPEALRARTLSLLMDILQKEHTPRADYRQVAELTIILLGGTPPRGIRWLSPGAIHQARWMAINIYAMKMFLFHPQFGYDEDFVHNLTRLNVFLSLFYVPAWMTATRAADAPVTDLALVQDMIRYKEYDEDVATTVLEKMKNHYWYLTQENVIVALFSKNLSDEEKRKIADKVLSSEKPCQFRMGKPVFPEITKDTSLSDLVGPESHTLFVLLQIGTDWLRKPVREWAVCDEYMKASEFVTKLKVVNDPAERSIKMMSDYAQKITTKDSERQILLRAVEYHRNKFQTFNKKDLTK